MTERKHARLDELPLFASDKEIARAVLGPERASNWRQIAPLLERRGLQKVCPLMGGRYVPAVKAFLDYEYGVSVHGPRAPQGTEGTPPWEVKAREKATRRS